VTTFLGAEGRRRSVYYKVRHKVILAADRFPAYSGPAVTFLRSIRHAVLVSRIRLLNNVLGTTPLAGRYWLCGGGLLLGWVREADALPNDLDDVDLGYMDTDRDRALVAFREMMDHGFAPHRRWVNNEGRTTEWTFRRSAIDFEFFEFTRVGDGQLENTGYFDGIPAPWDPGTRYEVRLRTLDRERSYFKLFGVPWLRAIEAVAELDALYGREVWTAPDEVFYSRKWNTGAHSPAVVSREPWVERNTLWAGDLDGP